MRKIKTIYMTLILLFISIPYVYAQENITNNTGTGKPQEKLIVLDTGGKTGHLIYGELYFFINKTGGVQYDHTRIYINNDINVTKVKFTIVRPLLNGKEYPENLIKAVATLNNETILDSWYSTKNESTSPADYSHHTPGFESILSILAFMLSLIIRGQYLKK